MRMKTLLGAKASEAKPETRLSDSGSGGKGEVRLD